MATIIFSPPIIKIIFSLAMVITAIGVTVWLIRDDIKKMKKMREQAERADRIWGRGREKEKANGDKGGKQVAKKAEQEAGGSWPVVTKGKIDDGQVSDLFPEPSSRETSSRSYPISKNKKRKPTQKDNHNRHKGGGAR